MKLSEEGTRSYIDDIRYIELIKFLTSRGDCSPTWIGKYMPATRSDDQELVVSANFNRAHYLFYRALVERHVERRGNVLDVGCGTGQRTAMLARYAERVIGVDSEMLKVAAASNLPHGAQNIDWAWGTIGDGLDGPSRGFIDKFDYIFCVEVIEHVELSKQGTLLDECLAMLAPGGRLLLTTPRDEVVVRKPPHIGLWDDEIAVKLQSQYGFALSYFNVAQLDGGEEDPWCDRADGTHYVVVAESP